MLANFFLEENATIFGFFYKSNVTNNITIAGEGCKTYQAIAAGGLGRSRPPRSPEVFGAKSCILAIPTRFIQTFGKSCFSILIFKVWILNKIKRRLY